MRRWLAQRPLLSFENRNLAQSQFIWLELPAPYQLLMLRISERCRCSMLTVTADRDYSDQVDRLAKGNAERISLNPFGNRWRWAMP